MMTWADGKCDAEKKMEGRESRIELCGGSDFEGKGQEE